MGTNITLKKWSALWGGAFILCIFSGLLFAAESENVHRALRSFDPDARENLPEWVQIWLKVMTVVLLSSVFFVIKHVEARWIAGGVVIMLLFSRFMVPALDITMLEGTASLSHVILWSPCLFFMLRNRPFLKKLSIYSVWSAIMTLIIILSFIFDVPDSIVYIHHLLT